MNSLSIHVTFPAIVPEAYPGESKMWLKNAHSLTSTIENQSLATDIPLYLRNGEDRWVHDARHFTSIEFSFDPGNIYRDGPRGVGCPADARSVGNSHPCICILRIKEVV